MDFDTWIADAWRRHADDPQGVLDAVGSAGAAAATDDAAVEQLLRLAQHVAGAHLGSSAALAAGADLLARLAALPAAGAAAQVSAALHRRALALTGSDETALHGLPPAAAVRVQALAAANLAERAARRAGLLLAQAVADAEAASLPDDDPAVRALAVAGNNIAAALAEQPARDDAARALMLQAAQVGLDAWRRAGTWLQEERAHHRLALCAALAGDAARAVAHAAACRAIVAREGDDALEAFFAHEAVALAQAAAGDPAAHARAVRDAHAAFARLGDDDRAACRETLLKLGTALP